MGGSREDFIIERKIHGEAKQEGEKKRERESEREQTQENECEGESARCEKERELRIGEERREK